MHFFILLSPSTLSEGPSVAWDQRCWQAENVRHDIVQEAWNSLTHALLPDVAHGDHVLLHIETCSYPSKLKRLPLFVHSFGHFVKTEWDHHLLLNRLYFLMSFMLLLTTSCYFFLLEHETPHSVGFRYMCTGLFCCDLCNKYVKPCIKRILSWLITVILS